MQLKFDIWTRIGQNTIVSHETFFLHKCKGDNSVKTKWLILVSHWGWFYIMNTQKKVWVSWIVAMFWMFEIKKKKKKKELTTLHWLLHKQLKKIFFVINKGDYEQIFSLRAYIW